MLYKDYDEWVYYMIDKKLGCLLIYINIVEFRYKVVEFLDKKKMFKWKESVNINLLYMLC